LFLIGRFLKIFSSETAWLNEIDASYQILVNLAKVFQRKRLKCEKLMDNRRQVMAKAHIAFGKVS
jgi:hypothetical protein